MSAYALFGILLSLVAGAFLAGYKLMPKHAVKLVRREGSRISQALTAELSKRNDEAALMVELTQTLTTQLERTLAERNDFERRAEENRKTIEAVLKERDVWQGLYDKQSIGHGNAQAIMMDTIGYLHQKLTTAGVTVELPEIVKQTQDQYIVAHVLPAVQRSGHTVLHRGDPPPNEVPAHAFLAPAIGKDSPSV